MGCKNCGEKIVQTPGKRPKEFCGSTCRSNYWQKEKRRSGMIILSDTPKPPKKAKEKAPVIEEKQAATTPTPKFKNEIERMVWENYQKRKQKSK